MNFNDLQKLDFDKFLWCWELNYYDGMISCIAFYDDKPVYVSCEEEETSFRAESKDQEGIYFEYPRIYKVYYLKNEDFIELYRRNLYWKKYVGIHNEFLPETLKRPFIGKVKAQTEWSKYPYWNDPYIFDKSNIVGYMTIQNEETNVARTSEKIKENDISTYFTEEQWKDLNEKYYISFSSGFLSLGTKEIYYTKPIIEE
jgi:hypothetical protein